MTLVFVGTYTESRTDGVFTFRLDEENGRLAPLPAADAGPNPTYLATHPRLPWVYVVNEAGEGKGTVTALRREEDGVLRLPPHNTRLSTRGSFPCHISLHPTLRYLLFANYTEGNDGSIGVLSLTPNGELGALTDFVRLGEEGIKSCAHCCVAAPPNGNYVLATDLKQNRIFVYQFDADRGKLTPHTVPFVSLPGASEQLPRGTGPRHLLFSPDGRFLYCINEYASSITVLAWNGDAGTLTPIQDISLLPADFTDKNWAAAVHFSPDGRFLYASNRGHDSLAILEVDKPTGHLTLCRHVPSGGGHPRDYAFSPSGAWLLAANRDADNLVVFRVNPTTGDLTPTDQAVTVSRPVCVKTA